MREYPLGQGAAQHFVLREKAQEKPENSGEEIARNGAAMAMLSSCLALFGSRPIRATAEHRKSDRSYWDPVKPSHDVGHRSRTARAGFPDIRKLPLSGVVRTIRTEQCA